MMQVRPSVYCMEQWRRPGRPAHAMDPGHEHQAEAHGRADAPAPDTVEHFQFALAAAHMGVFEWDVHSDVLAWSGTTGWD